MDSSKKVRVYWNLHKKCWSIQQKVNSSWKVIGHSKEIWMGDVNFKVSEKGRQRVLRERKKNVHSYAEGYMFYCDAFPCHPSSDYLIDIGWKHESNLRQITYNPYKYNSFVFADTEEKIEYAWRVKLENKKVYVGKDRTK